ncbi:polyisoprenoid-binding protein [Rufibacter sp. DG15C]|uniref:YceI family protein n=1 Tax=Rufibacter sp. DG15C TaxID=1379909 RepID=UPI00078C0E86|nr:YceI family protein [Rufibacter sp. DG15C]AMM49921.1 polyisoprenoid-binding protein [Rufibacter sp. DG15C]
MTLSSSFYRSGLLLGFCLLSSFVPQAQGKFFTKTGYISFYSKAPLEDIEAHNRQVVSFLDTSTGDLVFSVPMTAFQFKKALMQEHFNENYVESHKYPKATFKGKILNIKDIDFSQDRLYSLQLEGILTIHGVARLLRTNATLDVKGQQMQGRANFSVTPQEFNIEIPALVKDNIAKRIDISVQMLYKPYQDKTL